MKLADFTMETKNVAPAGAPEKMGEWITGSRSNLIGTGTYGGRKYQVKIHAAEPVWQLVDQKIREKKAELRACSSDDEEKKQRLQSELDTLERNRAKALKKDKAADGFLEAKQRLLRAINSIGSSQIVCPEDFWSEPIAMKGNGVCSVEAVPWVTNIAASYDGSMPTDFRRSLNFDQQCSIIASFCDQLAKLHQAGVLHGDLKLGNTLITKNGGELGCTIIDFDAALLLSDLHSKRYDADVWYFLLGGTFFSPELYELYQLGRECYNPDDHSAFDAFDFNRITPKSDIFALGITIYEYFYGPADGADLLPMVSPEGEALDVAFYGLAAASGYKPNLPDSVPDLLFGAINWMLAADPNDRPTAEQVRDVFKTKDTSKIPSQYVRNPLWEEHREAYELLPLPAGVSLKKTMRPRYQLIVSRSFINCSIDDLVKRGYAKRVGEEPVTPGAGPTAGPSTPVVTDMPWDCDAGKKCGTQKLPPCVVRAATSPLYKLYLGGGIILTRKYDDLVAEGYICTPEELVTPWPKDKDLHFFGSMVIKRDLERNKGVGHYIYGSGIRATTQELIAMGKASTSIQFTMFPDDAAQYEILYDNIPKNVKAISRTIMLHQYRIEYVDKPVPDKLMISELVARGFVRKK